MKTLTFELMPFRLNSIPLHTEHTDPRHAVILPKQRQTSGNYQAPHHSAA